MKNWGHECRGPSGVSKGCCMTGEPSRLQACGPGKGEKGRSMEHHTATGDLNRWIQKETLRSWQEGESKLKLLLLRWKILEVGAVGTAVERRHIQEVL